MISGVSALKVVGQLVLGAAVGIVHVAQNVPLLEQCYARGDVDGVLQVVTADDDCGPRLPVIVAYDALQLVLAGGVEEVEWLVEGC